MTADSKTALSSVFVLVDSVLTTPPSPFPLSKQPPFTQRESSSSFRSCLLKEAFKPLQPTFYFSWISLVLSSYSFGTESFAYQVIPESSLCARHSFPDDGIRAVNKLDQSPDLMEHFSRAKEVRSNQSILKEISPEYSLE